MIRLDGITKTYNDKVVLNNFSKKFENGKIYAVTGDSGRGKTTLLRIIAGLDKDYSGKVSFDREPKFSMVFQEDRLLFNLNVRENVELVCKDPKKATEILEKMGLEAELESRLSTLSGGMQRRVAIARALAADYNILLLDEPFSSVDEERKRKIMDAVKEMTADKLVILVTHDLREADYLGAEVIEI